MKTDPSSHQEQGLLPQEVMALWQEKIANAFRDDKNQDFIRFYGSIRAALHRGDSAQASELSSFYTPSQELESLLAEINEITDPKLAGYIVQENRWLFPALNSEIQNNREIAIAAVPYNTASFSILNDELKDDEDVRLALAGDPLMQGNNRWDVIRAFPESVRNDRSFVLKFLERNPAQIMGVRNWTPFGEDEEIILEALKRAAEIGKLEVMALTIGFSKVENDRKLLIQALRTSPNLFGYISENLKTEPDILEAAGRK